MSLPDVSFTNNLGTITFKRCVIGATDSWEWDGRNVKHVKTISINGFVKQGGASEKLDGILTDRDKDGRRTGAVGNLTLPWTTLSAVKLQGIEWGEGQWIDFSPVQCSFVDDKPYNNRYTFTLLGYTLYNPHIALPVPSRQLIDSYPQMRWTNGGGFIRNDPRAGVFRNRAGERNMDIQLGGTIQVADVKLPNNLLQTLQMRAGFNNPLPNVSVPGGYPQPFNLGDAVPELKDDLNLAHCIVVGGQVAWYVERQAARVDLQLLCPPQKLSRT